VRETILYPEIFEEDSNEYPDEWWEWEDCEGGGSGEFQSSPEEALREAIALLNSEDEFSKRGIQHFVKDASREEGFREEDWDLHIFRFGQEVDE
jgi:hypothetical protein